MKSDFLKLLNLEEGLEDSLAFYAFPELDTRKISSTNMLERLNKEIRRRTNVVGIFPNPDAYLRLVTIQPISVTAANVHNIDSLQGRASFPYD